MKLCRLSDFCSSKLFLPSFGEGELPDPHFVSPGTRACSSLMPVALSPSQVGGPVRLAGRGPPLLPSYPRSFLKHALIEKVCDAYCSTTPHYTASGVFVTGRLGGSRTFPIRGERDVEGEWKTERERVGGEITRWLQPVDRSIPLRFFGSVQRQRRRGARVPPGEAANRLKKVSLFAPPLREAPHCRAFWFFCTCVFHARSGKSCGCTRVRAGARAGGTCCCFRP